MGREIEDLLNDSLVRLRSARVRTKKARFDNYLGLTDDPKLGPLLGSAIHDLIDAGGEFVRVFSCDDLTSAVREQWFDEGIDLVKRGGNVYVIEMDDDVDLYEDLGVFDYKDVSPYMLRVPVREDHSRAKLEISNDKDLVAEYNARYLRLMQKAPGPLEVVRDADAATAEVQQGEVHGSARVSDLFEDKVVLRSMTRLDTGKRLLDDDGAFVRKYQMQYAQAFSNHVKSEFPDVNRIVFVGDTFMNDASVVRNLQRIGWDVDGYICDPKLGKSGVWFNKIFYSDCWTDLVAFARKITKPDARTLAIVDLDQTLWAPKGVHEGPLAATRKRAVAAVVDTYLDDSAQAADIKAKILDIYDEIDDAKYIPSLTLDNEDFKAAISAFIALDVLSRDIDSFVDETKTGEENIAAFVQRCLKAAETDDYQSKAERQGIVVERVRSDLRELLDKTVAGAPVPYPRFRAAELQEALVSVGANIPFERQIVLNKQAWDFANWLKANGATLIGISDRPDESTKPETGASLLEAEMTIYGKPIAQYLP